MTTYEKGSLSEHVQFLLDERDAWVRKIEVDGAVFPFVPSGSQCLAAIADIDAEITAAVDFLLSRSGPLAECGHTLELRLPYVKSVGAVNG